MITRSNPDVGYMSDEAFRTYGFTQSIRAGNMLYLSGVAPFKGNLDDVEVVGVGDIRAQVAQVLEIIQRCLAAEGATFKNWVAQTVYTTNMTELQKTADIFREAFGDYTPTSTWVEIKGLFVPEQLVEINGTAILD